MVHDDDTLVFAEEAEAAPSSIPLAKPWRVLIVDDDPEVHAITRVVLADVRFENRAIQFLSAHSAAEAEALLAREGDIAAILLDVVMETDDAGLRLVRHIRGVRGDHQVRIILRTGQPGQAPEREVIVAYDINDYKAKSELTSQKLFTTVVSALRSYQHIATIERGRRGLESIVDGAATLFGERVRDRFLSAALARMGALLGETRGAFICLPGEGGVAAATILDGTGTFQGVAGATVGEAVEPAVLADLERAMTGETVFGERHCVLAAGSPDHGTCLMYLATSAPPSPVERQLVETFRARIAVGFDNLALHERLGQTQRATVHALGKLAEYKDEVTGDHVRRIGRLSALIAAEMRARGLHADLLTDEYVERIELASMLHDVGKVAIPDGILKKPGILDDDEMVVMRGHATIGATILEEAAEVAGGHGYLSMGAEIALGHHEKFDGSGYPRRLAGEAIPLAARIVAVADVYDALLHARPYKPAWPEAEVLALLDRESGRHFDPDVVKALVAVLGR